MIIHEKCKYFLTFLCFLLSGFAALLYQTVWFRYFSTVFGTSELAVVTILAAYMGGLAIGAAVIGKIIHKLKRTVLIYAVLEIGIAVLALSVPLLLSLVDFLHLEIHGRQDTLTSSVSLTSGLFYFAAGFIVLLLPTALMGATLPLLTQGVVQTEKQIGNRVGTLYGVNTLGAILGTLLAAFILIPAIGLSNTVWVGIAANLLAGVLGLFVASRTKSLENTQEDQQKKPSLPSKSLFLILPIMLISGSLSFTYEVVWTRLLGHIVGASMVAFSVMLASFLAGIAIGSILAAKFAISSKRSAHLFVIAQLGTGIFSCIIFLSIDKVPDFAIWLNSMGVAPFIATTLCSICILLPSTICIGATFPLAVRWLTKEAEKAGSLSAKVYAWNTFGAIIGVFLTGFFLLPHLGFAGVIKFSVLGNLLLALGAAILCSKLFSTLSIITTTLVVALFFVNFTSPFNLLKSSAFGTISKKVQQDEIVYFKVGESSTVMMLREDGSYRIRTNGLPEALIPAKGMSVNISSETRWMGTLPTLLRPQTKSMLVIGLGGGTTLSGLSPKLENIDVIELEKSVLEANQLVSSLRQNDPLKDPRINIYIDDARGALNRTHKVYDSIVSQPSHPWTAGASHLYTKEFVETVASHLTEEGVYLQWMNISFVDKELLKTLLATVRSVFPHQQIYRVNDALLITSSRKPMQSVLDLPQLLNHENKLTDWSGWDGLQYIEDVAACLLMTNKQVENYCAGAKICTDDHNLMASFATKIRPKGALNSLRQDLFTNSYFVKSNLLAEFAKNEDFNFLYFLKNVGIFHSREVYEEVMLRIPKIETIKARALLHFDNNQYKDAIQLLQPYVNHDCEDDELLMIAAFSLLYSTWFPDDHDILYKEQNNYNYLKILSYLDPKDKELLEYFKNNYYSKVIKADQWIDTRYGKKHPLNLTISTFRAKAWLRHDDINEPNSNNTTAAKHVLQFTSNTSANNYLPNKLYTLRIDAAVKAQDWDTFYSLFYQSIGNLKYCDPSSDIYHKSKRIISELIQKYKTVILTSKHPRRDEFLRDINLKP